MYRFSLLCAIILFMGSRLSAQLQLGALFTDHMVLQRDQPIRIWGTAAPKTVVRVQLEEIEKSVKAKKDGRWMVEFPARPAGGPYLLEVESGTDHRLLQDILIGDVWLCSGQSNMEWVVQESLNADVERAGAKDTQIRHFKVPRGHADQASQEVAGGPWEVASPETVGDFSAVGYFFAKQLRQTQKVPIGLLNSSWGGSRIEPWMNAKTLGIKDIETALATYRNQAMLRAQATIDKLKAEHPGISTQARGRTEQSTPWAAADYDDTDWPKLAVPGLWEQQGYAGFDGTAWYRTTVTLSAAQAQQPATLYLAKIDDTDEVWVNGQRVGGMTQSYNQLRQYTVPAELLRRGTNTIAVWVEDTGGGGGIYGEADQVRIVIGTDTISLAGAWKFQLDALFPPDAQANIPTNKLPTLLYNKMIHPLLDFPLKGVLWYQGESNANSTEEALAYRAQFQGLIRQWRKEWKQRELPFLFVQLANFRSPATEAGAPGDIWPVLRESQTDALELPMVAQAVIIDIGEADDIHPRNKQEVGHRLALAARNIVYGEKGVVYHSPRYRSHRIEGNRLIVSFDHIAGGLEVDNPYGYVNGFAVAGPDQEYHWARALLNGNEVSVWSDAVAKPQYLRYAWADNPADVNLTNSEGLPAVPFRVE